MTWYYIRNSAGMFLTDLEEEGSDFFYIEDYERASLFPTRKVADMYAKKHNGTVHKVIITFEKEED